ncbi:MAG: DUF983 domain-containing protein [Planctomycetota bacterium]|jgi:uncharacterized protein (DUF983 family)
MGRSDGHTQQKVLIPALRRALKGRCPACGEGRIVVRFINLVRSCPSCGWILEREPGAITGSMYLVAILTQFAAVFLMLLAWLLTDWSPLRIVATGIPVLLVLSIIALAYAKRIWVAVEYTTDMRTDERDDDYDERGYAS